MKKRRTRRYNAAGRRIYSTLNKTSRQTTYSNTNPQFVMTCQSRSNGGGKGCTNAGCGNQCCLLSFLVRDISFNAWQNNISGIGIGQTLQNGAGGGGAIGTITEIVFPCACCQDIGLIGDNSYNNFPLEMRILAKPSSGSCANSGYTGGNLFTAQAGDISGSGTVEEAYEVLGTSNVGAPYRNPIKGWRKTLDCCECDNYTVTGDFQQTPNTNTLIGSTFTADGFSGIVEGYAVIGGTAHGYSLTLQTIDCPPKIQPKRAGTISSEPNNGFTIHTVEGITGRTRLVANDIYKDNYSGPKSSTSGCCPGGELMKSGIQGRTHHPIIRSGMQPKPNICCLTGKAATKCNTSGCIEKNNYAYDYYQYLHNKRCRSFERSQEKFFPMMNGIQTTLGGCVTGTCQHSAYRKSGCCELCGVSGEEFKNSRTTWKPNNRKFSKQGATTSSGRLERLKLDTIRTSNSKCPKGPNHPRCRTIVARNGAHMQTFLAPKGPYLAGRPRFTGWMYNARHPERVCMLRYRQQPFGIPQLTNRRRATRSNRLRIYDKTHVTISINNAPAWDNAGGVAPSSLAPDWDGGGGSGMDPPFSHPPKLGYTIQQLAQPASEPNSLPGMFPFHPHPVSTDPSGTLNNRLWLNQPTAVGTIIAIHPATPGYKFTIVVTAGTFRSSSPDGILYTMISKDTLGPAAWSIPTWVTSGHGESTEITLYQHAFSITTFDVTRPVDPKTRGIVGVWQRGNTNPRAPACKCVAEGSQSCSNPSCQANCGTGQMAINPGVPCCN